MGGEADGVDGVRRRARELIKEGADFIKVVASGGSTSTSDPYRPSLTAPEIVTIVEEAHGRGKPVAAHCRCTAAINNAVEAGVDMVLHCAFYDADGSYRFDQATAEALVSSGVRINPTLHLGRIRLNMLRRKREQEELTAEESALLETSEQGDRLRMEHFGRLIQMGVKLVGGSDCGWGSYPFGDFQGEIIAMVDAGLSPMEAILAGTRNGAEAMRVIAKVGTVEQEKEADLLVVDGDPAQDIAALRQVTAVFQGGRLVGGED
jgi:imidazolonepropionase-like amidohydrolase